MKKVCLDAYFLDALFRNHPNAVKRAGEYDSMDVEIFITSINAFETYFGTFRSKNAIKMLTSKRSI